MKLPYPFDDSPETHASLSLKYADEGLMPQAISRILKACQIHPKRFEYNAIAGAFFSRVRDYASSESYYKRALQQRPLDAVTRLKLASVQLRRGNLKHGTRNVMFVLALDPSLHRAWDLLLSVLERQHQWKDIVAIGQCTHDLRSRRLRIGILPDPVSKRLLPSRIFVELFLLRQMANVLKFIYGKLGRDKPPQTSTGE